MASIDLTQRPVFRMVHFNNVENILKNGMCCRTHPLADPDYINIGDTHLITQRDEYIVPINPPDGNLGDYVPFYFGGQSPMLLNIKTGHRGVSKRPQEDIIFVCCIIKRIVESCKEWCFTDGHAKDMITDFYNDLQRLDKIDWQMVYDQWWFPKDDDFDRQRRKQAEFLVKYFIPTSCIHSLIVRNQQRKDDIEQIEKRLGTHIPVTIDTNNKLFYP